MIFANPKKKKIYRYIPVFLRNYKNIHVKFPVAVGITHLSSFYLFI